MDGLTQTDLVKPILEQRKQNPWLTWTMKSWLVNGRIFIVGENFKKWNHHLVFSLFSFPNSFQQSNHQQKAKAAKTLEAAISAAEMEGMTCRLGETQPIQCPSLWTFIGESTRSRPGAASDRRHDSCHSRLLAEKRGQVEDGRRSYGVMCMFKHVAETHRLCRKTPQEQKTWEKTYRNWKVDNSTMTYSLIRTLY